MAQYRVVDKTTFTEIGSWTKEKIEAGVSNKVDKEQGKSLVSDTDVTQITTNKTSIETINSKLAGLQEAEEADIDALFAD